jgi:UDP-3-O-[3-hydroxymyristoyl] N-acetylglucosamine deacetylase
VVGLTEIYDVSGFFANTDLSFQQQTLADSFVCVGRGLHSGLRVVMSVIPAEPNTGIEFLRRDVTHTNNLILARWDKVSDTELSTTISNDSGIRVSTIEHLMAALNASGVDNARIVLDAPEVPIMDGSSAPFIEMIQKAGLVRQAAERQVIVIKRPIGITENKASASYLPSAVPWLDMSIEFSQRLIGRQRLSLPFTSRLFCEEVAGARTFGFAEHLVALKRRGLARGSSLDNAILIDNDKVVNCEGLRYADEFVRHKFLDAVGDLSLAGHYVIGHFKGHRSGHRMNNQLLRELFASNAWEMMSLRHAHDIWVDFMREQETLVHSLSA